MGGIELGAKKSIAVNTLRVADTGHHPNHKCNFSNAVYKKTDTTLAFADHCGRPVIQTTACVFTLPAISGALAVVGAQTFWIINGAPDGTLMTISPDSGKKFLWDVAGAAGTNNKDIINTAATAKQGDYVKLTYGSGDGWSILEMGGIWEDES